MNTMYVNRLSIHPFSLFRIYSWVVVPLWLMYDSYTHIAGALRAKQATKPKSA